MDVLIYACFLLKKVLSKYFLPKTPSFCTHILFIQFYISRLSLFPCHIFIFNVNTSRVSHNLRIMSIFNRNFLSLATVLALLFFVINVYANIDEKIVETAVHPEASANSSLLGTIATYAWNVFCVIGPVLQYYPTLGDIFSISPFIILILLASNIVRVGFWFARPFETPLLLQSFVMIATQTVLLNELTRQYKLQVKNNGRTRCSIWHDDLIQHFWQWTDLHSYQTVIGGFVSVLTIAHAIFHKFEIWPDVLGYLAALIEACLGVPQIYKNITQGCYGSSPVLFLTWLVGDLAKGAAFVATGAPFPFVICSFFQAIVDIVIIAQILYVNIFDKEAAAKAAKSKAENQQNDQTNDHHAD